MPTAVAATRADPRPQPPTDPDLLVERVRAALRALQGPATMAGVVHGRASSQRAVDLLV